MMRGKKDKEKIDEIFKEFEELRTYHNKWCALTNVFKDDFGNKLTLGDIVEFKIDVSDWGKHRNGIHPSNLEFNGRYIATFKGRLNFDEFGKQFCINTDYYFLPSIYISCIKEGSLKLCEDKTLDKAEIEEEFDSFEK